jgi:hypothetical protein
MTGFAKLLAAAALAAALPAAYAVELDPKAVVYQLPDQIKWSPVNPAGAQQAVLFGDPAKPGLYGVLTKWTAGNHFSKPHFHPNDRFITVLSGTWWVGSGPNWDPANASAPMPAGSFVTHYGKQVHWGRRQGCRCRTADRRRRSGDHDAFPSCSAGIARISGGAAGKTPHEPPNQL